MDARLIFAGSITPSGIGLFLPDVAGIFLITYFSIG
jgi:hypothetical protein